MMPYIYGSSSLAAYPQPASQQTIYSQAALMEDFTWQLRNTPTALRRRHSRGAAAATTVSQRTPGSAMRVVKPSSANNSPRSVMQPRRRTFVNEAPCGFMAQQQQQQQASHIAMETQDYQYDQYAALQQQQQYVQPRPARPVSWHPGSTLAVPSQFPVSMAATQFQMQAYGTPTVDIESFPSAQAYTLSPAAYSSQTSPSTAFSPYVGAFDAGHYYSPNPWTLSPSVNTNGILFDKLPSPVDCPALIPVSVQDQAQPVYEHQSQNQNQQPIHGLPAADMSTATVWNTLAAPPTPPDSCFSVAQPAQAPLEEDDSDEEILVGMGLYDPPEKELTDPTLESYRSSVAHMLGTSYKYPESTGKGLKLEDAWEPPENMDDDDDDDDDENDAEGEEQ